MAGTLTIATLSDGTNSTSSTNCIQGSAKAWVKFVGSSGSISASYNVSSVSRTATGHYTINFTNALPNANYAVGGMVFNQSSGNGTRCLVSEGTPTTSALQVFNMLFNGSQEDANASVAVFD
jgi:hypothetical protein